MSLASLLLALTWIAMTTYVLFAGADFGAGFWDLFAGRSSRGQRPRELIEHAIGPIWEANHVWLIFVLVLMWTAFPPVFAAVTSTLYIPLTLIAIGIIARGSAFAFRKAVTELWQRRLFGATFAFSSVVTPFFLGEVAGAVATGRVPRGFARGDIITSWWNPVGITCGVLAVGVCAYLSAVYLTADARRSGALDLSEYFRLRALIAGVIVGVMVVAALVIVHEDAPGLFHGLTHHGLPLVILSVVAGLGSLVLLGFRHYLAARPAAGLAVAAVLWGWGVSRYPHLLPGLDIDHAAAPHATLVATTIAAVVGLLLVLPALAWLLLLFQRAD